MSALTQEERDTAAALVENLIRDGWLPPHKAIELNKQLKFAVDEAQKYKTIAEWNHNVIMQRDEA